MSDFVRFWQVLSDFLWVRIYIFEKYKIYTILNNYYYEKSSKIKQVAAMDCGWRVWADAHAKCDGRVGV